MSILDNWGINNRPVFFRVAYQFLKFGAVGLVNTAISLSVYYIFVWVNPNWFIAGNSIGFVLSVINACIWNRKYVFTGESIPLTTALRRSFVAYGGTFLISSGMLIAMVDCWGVSKFIAPLANLAITIPLNFLVNKFWTFYK